MKKLPFVVPCLLAAALSACGADEDNRTLSEKTKDAAHATAEKTKEVASEIKTSVSAKLTEWKLTPADIKEDLKTSGRVVRNKAEIAGAKLKVAADNGRIVTLINTKYIADKDLSALKINVDADAGVVTLRGTVTSDDLIGKAVVLALDTTGVTSVVSLLTVEAK